VPIAPCPVAGHHWKESGPVLLTPTLQIFRGISKVPSQPSLLQAKQAQLAQPLLIGSVPSSPVPQHSTHTAKVLQQRAPLHRLSHRPGSDRPPPRAACRRWAPCLGSFPGREVPVTPAWEPGSSRAENLGLWGVILGHETPGTPIVGQKTYISPWENTLGREFSHNNDHHAPSTGRRRMDVPLCPRALPGDGAAPRGTASPDGPSSPLARRRSTPSQDVPVRRRKAGHKSLQL